MSETAAHTAKKMPFITLCNGRSRGFQVVHWTGGYHGLDYGALQYRGGTLFDFLKRMEEHLPHVQRKLNAMSEKLVREIPPNPRNRTILRGMNGFGSWAYSVACDMSPFVRLYDACPANFLYADFVFLIEEIHNKCFAASHMFGDFDEARVGLQGVLTDFVRTGGVGCDGVPNECGIRASIQGYQRAYFEPNGFHPVAYGKFAELMVVLVTLVVEKHPRVCRQLSDQIGYLYEIDGVYFKGSSFTSPEKVAMLDVLKGLKSKLSRADAVLKQAS